MSANDPTLRILTDLLERLYTDEHGGDVRESMQIAWSEAIGGRLPEDTKAMDRALRRRAAALEWVDALRDDKSMLLITWAGLSGQVCAIAEAAHPQTSDAIAKAVGEALGRPFVDDPVLTLKLCEQAGAL